MRVIGIGEKKTPTPFIAACDRFIYIEVLEKDDEITPSKRSIRKKIQHEKVIHKIDKRTLNLVFNTIEDLGDEDGWAFLGDVGNLLIKKSPQFDPRNYGFLKLTPMLKYLSNDIEIDERNSEDRRIKHVFVRLKNN